MPLKWHHFKTTPEKVLFGFVLCFQHTSGFSRKHRCLKIGIMRCGTSKSPRSDSERFMENTLFPGVKMSCIGDQHPCNTVKYSKTTNYHMSRNPAYTVGKPVNTFSFTALYMKEGGEGSNYQVPFSSSLRNFRLL